MAVKKSELYSILWEACNKLRGGVEPSRYKDYVLVLYVSFNNPDELGKGKEFVDKVSGLIKVFQNPAIDFKSNMASGDDIIGDAYEYFMMKFAQESGKSKGQFYTPSEVSRTIARLIGIGNIDV